MDREMQIIREVSIAAEDLYAQAVSLGDHAAEALKARHRAQLTGLENITESALKTSDVFDYIKKQTARSRNWQQPFSQAKNSHLGFGEALKTYLENDLARSRDEVCTRLSTGDTDYKGKQERRHIYLLLLRQFIRSLVVQYEYRVNSWAQANGGKE